MNDGMMRDTVVQLEQLADRAMDACRKAGNNVDGNTQQAVKRMHEEASSLKHELMQHA
jgi:ribosome recycling factor